MNKTELISAIAEDTGSSNKDAKSFLESFINIVQNQLAANKDVAILGFGTFKPKELPDRMGRNPQTGETVQIAASRKPEFKPGAAFKSAVDYPK